METPTCDFDTWTKTGKTAEWLTREGATLLKSAWGFDFWEHPTRGDEAPVLATEHSSHTGAPVWNTQDFDLPTHNPREAW